MLDLLKFQELGGYEKIAAVVDHTLKLKLGSSGKQKVLTYNTWLIIKKQQFFETFFPYQGFYVKLSLSLSFFKFLENWKPSKGDLNECLCCKLAW